MVYKPQWLSSYSMQHQFYDLKCETYSSILSLKIVEFTELLNLY